MHSEIFLTRVKESVWKRADLGLSQIQVLNQGSLDIIIVQY